jgi:hypothetical protein
VAIDDASRLAFSQIRRDICEQFRVVSAIARCELLKTLEDLRIG